MENRIPYTVFNYANHYGQVYYGHPTTYPWHVKNAPHISVTGIGQATPYNSKEIFMEQRIRQGNEVIAGFMDLYRSDSSGFGDQETEMWFSKKTHNRVVDGELKYHKSWDALKPVIDEIFKYALALPDAVEPFVKMSICVDIIPAWEAVVKFITDNQSYFKK